MASEERDRQEVDRLVRELSAPKLVVVPKPSGTDAATPPVQAAAAEPPAPRKVSRWTTARILMPATSAAAAEPRRTLASLVNLPQLSALKLPTIELPTIELPALRLPSLPAFAMPALSEQTRGVFMVRAWVTLGILLSVSMPFWPYPKTYLVGILAYLFAIALVMIAGVWSAKLTWDGRLGGAHALSLGVVFWAIVLVAAETLPPVGS